MKCNRANATLTFSAALAGLALTVLTPAAHGHGNNPRIGGVKPHTNPTPPQPPPPPPPDGSQNDTVSGGPNQTPHVPDSILDPGIVIDIDLTQDSFNVLSRVVSEPLAASMIVNPVAGLAPRIAVELSGASGSGSIQVPASGVIPSPGTLVLLGLAAASAGRRRRRH